jgi:hypothetical protein
MNILRTLPQTTCISYLSYVSSQGMTHVALYYDGCPMLINKATSPAQPSGGSLCHDLGRNISKSHAYAVTSHGTVSA